MDSRVVVVYQFSKCPFHLGILVEGLQICKRLLCVFREGQISEEYGSLARIQLQSGIGRRDAQCFADNLLPATLSGTNP